jgi:integrase
MGIVYKRTYKDKKTGELKESAVYWAKYYRNGIPIRESTGTAVFSEARTFLNRREGDVAKGAPITPKMGRVKFREITEDIVKDYDVNGRRSARDLEARLRLHILPYFGEARASALSAVDFRKFIDFRQREGAKNAEINRELAAIKRTYSLAVQAGRIFQRPYIPMLKENNVRSGFFEREQFESIRKHLSEDLAPMITFAYITGWRTYSEVMPLKWSQVDLEAGRVRLEPGTTKNNDGREFPLTQELRSVLEAQKLKATVLRKRGIICPWVFNRRGKPIMEFRRAWKTACKKAGLPGRIPHDFRRTAVRNLVRAGIPERVAMMMTGHKTRSVFERYNIVSTGDFDQAAKRLDEINGHSTGTVTGTVSQNTANAAVAISTQPTVESIRYKERTRSSVG